ALWRFAPSILLWRVPSLIRNSRTGTATLSVKVAGFELKVVSSQETNQRSRLEGQVEGISRRKVLREILNIDTYRFKGLEDISDAKASVSGRIKYMAVLNGIPLSEIRVLLAIRALRVKGAAPQSKLPERG